MTENISQANSTIWIFAVILVGWTVVQAALFVRLALRFNKKHNLYSPQELKRCIRTGAIATIGPGINSMFLAISMMAVVGSGLTFFRCGVIGAPAFEMTIISYANTILGFDPTTTGLTNSVMTFYVFAGLIGTISLILGPLFLLRPLELGGSKKGSGKPSMLMRVMPTVSVAIMIVYACDYLTGGWARAVGYLISAGVTALIFYLVSKGKKGLGSWCMLLATFAGIIGAQIVATLLA